MADITYNRFRYNLMKKLLNLDAAGDTIKVQLHTSSYTPNKDHNTTANLTNEVASGNGYATGGATLANQAISQVDASDVAKFDADDVTWSASTITARYAVLVDTTASNALICCFDFGSDQSSSSGNFTLAFNASGILTIA